MLILQKLVVYMLPDHMYIASYYELTPAVWFKYRMHDLNLGRSDMFKINEVANVFLNVGPAATFSIYYRNC